MLQDESNTKSAALSVWKWQPDTDQGVLESMTKFNDFCILAVFNLDKIESVAYTWPYFYSM